MSSDWIASFAEGLQSVVNVSGAVKGVISSSVAEGVENGFYSITPRVIRLVIVSGLLLTGLLVFALGFGQVLENTFQAKGSGYLLAGAVFIAVGAIGYASNRR
ncbi:TPA: hypothetical protein HA318_03045 [Candidatus Micrarchaeota archaeon]|nr:MAG: hypothetical protein AUJ65_01200 [Candidatus Micrarchaeota archaeon CG1_02_51_15]HII38956.1 hypothetical protein [Candidatus Micrarchaeota archaeon]